MNVDKFLQHGCAGSEVMMVPQALIELLQDNIGSTGFPPLFESNIWSPKQRFTQELRFRDDARLPFEFEYSGQYLLFREVFTPN